MASYDHHHHHPAGGGATQAAPGKPDAESATTASGGDRVRNGRHRNHHHQPRRSYSSFRTRSGGGGGGGTRSSSTAAAAAANTSGDNSGLSGSEAAYLSDIGESMGMSAAPSFMSTRRLKFLGGNQRSTAAFRAFTVRSSADIADEIDSMNRLSIAVFNDDMIALDMIVSMHMSAPPHTATTSGSGINVLERMLKDQSVGRRTPLDWAVLMGNHRMMKRLVAIIQILRTRGATTTTTVVPAATVATGDSMPEAAIPIDDDDDDGGGGGNPGSIGGDIFDRVSAIMVNVGTDEPLDALPTPTATATMAKSNTSPGIHKPTATGINRWFQERTSC